MKKFIVHILLLMALCVVCSRCKHLRDENHKELECTYNGSFEGLKEWYYYKVGTYWIYEDINSGVRDTLTVFENESSEDNVTNRTCIFRAYSTFYDGSINVYFDDSYTIHCLNYKVCDCKKIRWGFNSTTTGITGGGWYFLYPHILNNYNNVNGAVSKLSAIYPELTVQDITYLDVVVYNAENSFIEGSQDGGDSGTQV
jgi:hypothetical protein